ncbi:MAG: STAS domain-containing protein [Desulfobacterales bacterium]|jgi:anti-sigma B factor antagonist
MPSTAEPITPEIPSTLIRISKVGMRTIVAPTASLSYQNIDELATVLKDCIQQPKTEVILDCKAVRFLDSSVLELLVRVHHDLNTNGGVLKIIGLNENGRDIFYATRLTNVLNVFNDIHEAIRHNP